MKQVKWSPGSRRPAKSSSHQEEISNAKRPQRITRSLQQTAPSFPAVAVAAGLASDHGGAADCRSRPDSRGQGMESWQRLFRRRCPASRCQRPQRPARRSWPPDAVASGLTVGGGGYNARGRWRIGGEGHGILGRGREESEFATDASGGYGLVTVGYSVPGAGRVALVREFGIGGGGLTATITEREAGTFDRVLADPRRGVRLSRGAVLTTVGVVAHFSLGDALMGIRAGYLLPLAQSSWTTDGAPISGGSSFTSQGAFLRLTIGGGGRSSSNRKTQEVTP